MAPERGEDRPPNPIGGREHRVEFVGGALDRVAAELGELVEEQHPVVREGFGMYLEARGSVMYLETPLGPLSRQ